MRVATVRHHCAARTHRDEPEAVGSVAPGRDHPGFQMSDVSLAARLDRQGLGEAGDLGRPHGQPHGLVGHEAPPARHEVRDGRGLPDVALGGDDDGAPFLRRRRSVEMQVLGFGVERTDVDGGKEELEREARAWMPIEFPSRGPLSDHSPLPPVRSKEKTDGWSFGRVRWRKVAEECFDDQPVVGVGGGDCELESPDGEGPRVYCSRGVPWRQRITATRRSADRHGPRPG